MKYKNDNKTLLILDLDETLVFATSKQLERAADFEVFSYYIYKRPYLNEFLHSVNNDYQLAVWSSASDDYVQEVAQQIFPKDIDLKFVWGRSRSTYQRKIQMNPYTDWYDNSHHYYIKNLKKLKRQGYQLQRILIVDDTPHKAQNDYGNAIYPTEYEGDVKDNELQKLAYYLKPLKDKTNVRRIEKRNWRSLVDKL